MIAGELLHDFPRNGTSVSTEVEGITYMFGMAYRREHDFTRIAIAFDGIDTLVNDTQGIMSLVLQASHKRTDICRPGAHGNIGLLYGINQMQIDHHASIDQLMAGTRPFQRDGNLENGAVRIKTKVQQTMGFRNNFIPC